MSILHGTLRMGRRTAEARFTETFTLERDMTTDDAKGVPRTTTTPLQTGVAGRVKFASEAVANREHGAQLVAVQKPEVHVGVGSVHEWRTGDFYRCTASTVDPGLVGSRYRIEGKPESGQTTAWRFPVTEVS